MAKKHAKTPPLSGTLTVKNKSVDTGKVTYEEIDLSSLTVREVREKIKQAYGIDISRADVRRLLKEQTVNLDVLYPERPAPKA